MQAEAAYEVEKFDLSIYIDDSQKELTGQISYATALFHKDTIERLIRHYTYLLEQLTEAPEQPYSQHSLLALKNTSRSLMNGMLQTKIIRKTKQFTSYSSSRQKRRPIILPWFMRGEQLSL